MLKSWIRTTPWLLFTAAFALTAHAQTARPENNTAKVIPGQVVVDEATAAIQRAKQDPEMASLIDHSKAVFVVPHYGASSSRFVEKSDNASPEGNAATTAKAMASHGNPGVLLKHTASNWSSPAFFSVNAPGADSAYESTDTANGQSTQFSRRHGMPVVMVFMTAQGANQMITTGTFSLTGLNVADYSAHPKSSLSDADVVLWTPRQMTSRNWLEGSDIHYDGSASSAYYRNQATLPEILSSSVSTPRAANLQGALSTRVAEK